MIVCSCVLHLRSKTHIRNLLKHMSSSDRVPARSVRCHIPRIQTVLLLSRDLRSRQLTHPHPACSSSRPFHPCVPLRRSPREMPPKAFMPRYTLLAALALLCAPVRDMFETAPEATQSVIAIYLLARPPAHVYMFAMTFVPTLPCLVRY